MKTYPCPSDRDLTDAELERICAEGEREIKKHKKNCLPGDEWKEQ
jgi:hypothetical protein